MGEFQIRRHPVTNAQDQRLIRDTGHPSPQSWEGVAYPEKKGDHPVVWVNSDDAAAYAEWNGCRLPTFEEWTRAARGDDGRRFPWGNEIDKPRCNTAELGAGGTTPVGAFPSGVSPVGCYDMMGNVWEWTQDCWTDDYTGAAQDGRARESLNCSLRVLRGGSWSDVLWGLRSADRLRFPAGIRNSVNGFRVARTIGSAP